MRSIAASRNRFLILLAKISTLFLITITVGVAVLFLFVAIGTWTDFYKILTVLSGSMEPTMPKGALIINTPVAVRSIQTGDIITFQTPEKPSVLETHRVIRIIESGPQPILQTKGDANMQPDPWNLRLTSEPAWKLQFVIPGMGYVLEWFRGSVVHALTVIFAPFLLCVLWLCQIWKPKDKKGVTRI